MEMEKDKYSVMTIKKKWDEMKENHVRGAGAICLLGENKN
jgi:hypothetical protein